MENPDDVTKRVTEAARRVLRKQAKQAGARDAFKCSMMAGKRVPKRRPLKELFADGKFTVRITSKDELQRHCEEVFEDVKETIELWENRIKKYKTDGDRHFTEEGCCDYCQLGYFRQELRWRKRERESLDQSIPL